MSHLRKLFLHHVAQTSEMPMCLEVDKASGMYIYGRDGKKYLDFDSGISVSSLGHCYLDVVEAIKNQSSTYMHTMVYGEHIQSPQVEYAALLCDVLDHGLDNIYYVNSGSEAVEVALKLARKCIGRSEIISAANAYHGSTIAAESLRSDTPFTMNYMPSLPGVRHISFNDLNDLNKITEKTACVIMEPVQAEAGIIVPDDDYLIRVKERCQKTGTLFVLDEIQTGFGRTGQMFAHQKFGVKPDILLLAKGMGGGMPIGAVVANKSLMHSLAADPSLGHITTFGGHPVCVAAALATLKVLKSQDYIATVYAKEQLFHALLVHPLIREVRSSGLMMAVEINQAHKLSVLIDEIVARGVLVDYFLFDRASFRIAPPLIIHEDEIRLGVKTILEAMDAVSN